MSWFKEEPRNFPILASRDLLPNLWLKYERSDRVPLRKSDCMSTFAALTSDMKKTHADKVLWTSLEDFDPETHMGAFSDWLQNVKWPKAPKELRDPVGHTAFASSDLRDAWLACARLNWEGQQKQMRDDCDKCFRVDNYGNVISIFARINSPCATAYDHFFPFSRGGRTRSVPGATHTNIIMIQWKANSVKSDTIEQLLQPAELTNGLKAEQVIAALTSSNGFYGVPAVPFILGYDPLVDAETVLPDRSDIFPNWKQADVEGGKPYRTQIIEALCRIREAEVTREQRYIERKLAREGSSAKRKVQPYAFAFTNTTAPKTTDAATTTTPLAAPAVSSSNDAENRMRMLEYGAFLRATLLDGVLSPLELESLNRLRARLSITDAEHDACLRDTSYGVDLSAFAGTDSVAWNEAVAKGAAEAAQSAAKPSTTTTTTTSSTTSSPSSSSSTNRQDALDAMSKASEVAATMLPNAEQRSALALARERAGATADTLRFLQQQAQSLDGRLQAAQLSSYSLVELKSRCRSLNLPVSGKKEELVKRIEEALTKKDETVNAIVESNEQSRDALRTQLNTLTVKQLEERAATSSLYLDTATKRSKPLLVQRIFDAELILETLDPLAASTSTTSSTSTSTSTKKKASTNALRDRCRELQLDATGAREDLCLRLREFAQTGKIPAVVTPATSTSTTTTPKKKKSTPKAKTAATTTNTSSAIDDSLFNDADSDDDDENNINNNNDGEDDEKDADGEPIDPKDVVKRLTKRRAALRKLKKQELLDECARCHVPTTVTVADPNTTPKSTPTKSRATPSTEKLATVDALIARLCYLEQLATMTKAELRAECVVSQCAVIGSRAVVTHRLLLTMCNRPDTSASSAADDSKST